MKTKISVLVIAICVAQLLQSCKENSLSPQTVNVKSFISKVSGTIQSSDPNFFPGLLNNAYTYTWTNGVGNFGPNNGTFQSVYSYAANTNVSQVLFLNNGHYDFTYNGSQPDKVIDNSFPGRDFGYWQFYLNPAHQVNKIGLAFSAAALPTSFEFYSYNASGQLSSFIYGKAIDTPRMRVLYQYDPIDNLSEFDIYLPQGSPLLPAGMASSAQVNSVDIKNTFVPGRMIAMNKKLKINNQPTPEVSTVSGNPETIKYVLYLTAKVTSDGNPNPFTQQGNIFFYQTNRLSSFYDPNPFYISLMKSNPVKIEYTLPVYGDTTPSAVQTFTYTYNSKGYPVTIHQQLSDDLHDFTGSCTEDTNIEYHK